MNCPLQTNEGAEWILEYCAGRLESEKTLDFERHLAAGCDDCNRVVSAQRAVWDALDDFEAMPVSEDFDERLWKRIEASESRSWWRRLLDGPVLGWSSLVSWKPALVTASACAAVLAVMLVNTPSTSQNVPVVEKALVEKAMMERVDLDQVESAIDDLDMLRQLGVVEDPSQPPA